MTNILTAPARNIGSDTGLAAPIRPGRIRDVIAHWTLQGFEDVPLRRTCITLIGGWTTEQDIPRILAASLYGNPQMVRHIIVKTVTPAVP